MYQLNCINTLYIVYLDIYYINIHIIMQDHACMYMQLVYTHYTSVFHSVTLHLSLSCLCFSLIKFQLLPNWVHTGHNSLIHALIKS